MTHPHPTSAGICAAYDCEYTARRKHWIGGVPDPSDLSAIRQIIAYRLRVTLDDVAEALRDRGMVK